MKKANSQAMWQRSAKVIPLGVQTNFRYYGPDDTMYIGKAQGAYIWDVDDNRYVDYKLGFGPVILGHGYEEVRAKVSEATRNGTSYATSHPLEVSAAEKIVSMCPSVDKVRFANSGMEATLHALRIARGYTGREKIVKFEGCYHGTHDYLMWTLTPGAIGHRRDPIPLQSSSGIPRAIRDLIITVPFNDSELLERTLERAGHEVAAIIVPPLHTTGCMEPADGWLAFLRAKCDEYRIVLIFDEVQTGFRLAKGGAAEHFGVMPDLCTYAKAMGNGYPVAAFGGRDEVMAVIGQGVAHAGTYNGNVVSTAAVDATLGILQREPVLEHVADLGKRLTAGMRRVFDAAGVPVAILGHPAQFCLNFGEGKPTDLRSWAEGNAAYSEQLSWALHRHGVMRPVDPTEPWFISYSHTAADIDDTLNRLEDAVRATPYA